MEKSDGCSDVACGTIVTGDTTYFRKGLAINYSQDGQAPRSKNTFTEEFNSE